MTKTDEPEKLPVLELEVLKAVDQGAHRLGEIGETVERELADQPIQLTPCTYGAAIDNLADRRAIENVAESDYQITGEGEKLLYRNI